MTVPVSSAKCPDQRLALVAGLAVAAFHLLFAGRYDLFRDELYFIICGQHPAFGYVDQPPGVPLLAAGLFKLGWGAFGLRVPTALAGGALVWLAMRFARLLGGGRLAQAMAGLACALAPMLMGIVATLNTSAFEPLAWTALAYLLVKAGREGDDRALLGAGLLVGLTLEIKYAMLFWLVGLTAGLLVTPGRVLLRRPALWGGVAIAAIIAVPSFLWQYAHGFPFLELAAAAKGKNAAVDAVPFLVNQVLVMNPAFAPLWIAGLAAPFLARRLADLRFLVIGAVVVIVIVRLGHGKDYYLAPLYPTLFVIGATALVPWVKSMPAKVGVAAIATAAFIVAALAAPLALPILSPAALERYVRATGLAPQQQERSFAGTALPQSMADQLGWRDFARQVDAAWASIPASERAVTAIKVDNYGEAAALDIYGHGLPPALSGHNQYYLWGLRGQHPIHVLSVQDDLAAMQPYCRKVTLLGQTWSRYAMAYENGKVIALCENVKPSLTEMWPDLKNFS
ncbi:4-amino-4-deoxy-L-arabinose transferase-like glycosyltransferase [Novosphingobium sp. 1529]|uniref:ArnT family glycosyltransferase n=1 Tax=Novosphingobium sp. 1529 TaxID=3156424 RepID=UPI003394961B